VFKNTIKYKTAGIIYFSGIDAKVMEAVTRRQQLLQPNKQIH
jgi:hypothetical protein